MKDDKKRKKLSLTELEIKSFMTSDGSKNLAGGSLLSGGGCDDSWLQMSGCRVTELSCLMAETAIC